MSLHRAAPRSLAAVAYIPDGHEGTRLTLEVMRRLVKEWRANPEMIAFARSLVEGVQEKNFREEAAAVHAYVRDQIRYTLDPNEVETVQAPNVTIETGHGDCDDKSVLVATLLEILGHPARFAAIGFAPDVFEHVYVETKIGADWIGVETTEPVELGWQPQGFVSKMLRHI